MHNNIIIVLIAISIEYEIPSLGCVPILSLSLTPRSDSMLEFSHGGRIGISLVQITR